MIAYLRTTRFYPSAGMRALGRSIALAALVGLVAGVGAVLFHLACITVSHFALVELAGYDQRGPANELGYEDVFGSADASGMRPVADSARRLRPWMLVLVPVAGGLLSGWIVYRFAPEASGHGTDAAIDAYHNKRGRIRARVPLVKMVSSAITLGTGGSGGREGPIAQIGAGFGSFLATKLRLSDAEHRTLMAAGLGAGIGAIFHAPLAGALFSAEVLYRDPDVDAENLIPSFIATTVAYCTLCLVFGFKTLFAVEPMPFNDPLLLLPLTVLTVVVVLGSLAYTRCFYGMHHLFEHLPMPRMLKPALGAGLAGLVALGGYYAMTLVSPEAQHDSLSVLSFGYGILQKMLLGDLPAGLGSAAALLAFVAVGKILTTSLTIGSGGSGGVFGPSMVIGGSLGALSGLMLQALMPDTVTRIDMFVILGMAGFFAAAANTPLSTLIMVSEMTGSYTLLLPAMWVCALAYLMGRRWTLFENQVANRLESPAHRGDFIVDVLEGLTIRDALHRARRQFVTVPMSKSLGEMAYLLTDTRQTSFPVLDEQNHYYGLFSLADIRQYLYETGQFGMLTVAQDLADTDVQPLTLGTNLSDAISQFATGRFEELPVVDEQQSDQIIGLLRRMDVIAVYSAQLMQRKQVEGDAT